MATILFSGTPGSGKSYIAATKIYNRIKWGYNCIGNFPINYEVFGKKKKIGNYCYLNNQEMTVDALMNYAKLFHKPNRESQTLIVIDECGAMFNCRQWDNKERMAWLIFFQQHRKFGFDILLISQHDRLIDRQIRANIETEYKCRSLSNYNWFGKILALLAGGRYFVCVEVWYGTKLKVGQQFFRLNKRIAKIYDTFQRFI